MQTGDTGKNMVEQLLEMGFKADQARQAIQCCGPDITKCVAYLAEPKVAKKKPSKPPKSTADKAGNDKVTEPDEETQDQLPLGYTSPQPGEADHLVTFSERTLGFEITPSKDGNNCCVERRVSKYAMDNVGKGWAIAQVNDKWIYGQTFDTIRNAIKTAAETPPLTIRFRSPVAVTSPPSQQLQLPQQPQTQSQLQSPPRSHSKSHSQPQSRSQPHSKQSEAEEEQEEEEQEDHTDKGTEEDDSGKSEEYSTYLSHKHDTQSPYSSSADGKKHVAYAYDDYTYPNGEISQRTQPNYREDEEKTNHPFDTATLEYDGERSPSLWWMSSEQAKTLKVNDKIDHRNEEGKFVPAKIVDKQGTMVRVHYQGTSPALDVWSDYVKEYHRFALFGSISQQPNTRFPNTHEGDRFDVLVNSVWRVGRVQELDPKSGQVRLQYTYNGKSASYWAHLNNTREIAPLYEKSRSNEQTKSFDNPSQTSEIASGSRIGMDELSKRSSQNTNCHNNNNNNNHNNNNNNNRNAYNHHNNMNNRNNNNRHNNHHNNNNNHFKKKKKKDKYDNSSSDTNDEDNDSDTSKRRKSRRSSSSKISSHPPFRMSSEVNIGGDRRHIAKKTTTHNARSQSFANRPPEHHEHNRQGGRANAHRRSPRREEPLPNNKSRVENDTV